jgi:hypothetical protein
MIAESTCTYQRILELLADGEWHTEEELEELAYFPREWIKELEISGEPVTTVHNGVVRVRLEPNP